MKLPWLLFSVLSFCFSACNPQDNDKPLGPDVPDCTQQQSASEPFLTLDAHEFEPGKTDTIGLSTSEVTIVQQYFPGDSSQVYIDVIHALLNDRYSVVIKLTRSLSDGMGMVSFSNEVTISTTDSATGTGEEINGNLYFGPGGGGIDDILIVSFRDCLVTGSISGSIPQVSPEEEMGSISFSIVFSAKY